MSDRPREDHQAEPPSPRPPMRNRHILKAWTEFKKTCVHPQTPPPLIAAMQCAFYGGVAILYKLLTNLSPGDDSTPDDIRMLHDIHAELKEFTGDAKNFIIEATKDAPGR